MASVQMSQTLRDQITDNYQQQLYNAYRKHHDVQPAIDAILQGIIDNDSEFATLCKINEELEPVLKSVKEKYKEFHQYYSSDPMVDELIKCHSELGLICNPNRKEKNLSFITNWHAPYNDEYNEDKQQPASANHEEGDVPVKIEHLNPFYTPVKISINYERGWQRKQFAPHTDGSALLVTDPDLCAQLSPIGEIEVKVGNDVETFKEYISKITTLKRFIDEWPGGKDLVPEEYLQRMLTKKTPAKANRMSPDQIIPDELKEQMNEVILTNKLLGDD